MEIPKPKAGEPVIEWANRITDVIRSLRVVPGPGMSHQETPGGTVIGVDSDIQGTVVKVTGGISGGTYPGKIQLWNGQTSAWTDGVDCEIILL